MAGTAVITGAGSARGIGAELARRLAKSGWNLGLVDIDESAVKALAGEIEAAFGVRALGVGADISDETAVDEAISRFEQELPPIQALVNSAGVSSPVAFLDLDLATWERVMRINATGTFVITRRVVPGMMERGYGRVVSLGSTAMQNGGGTFSKSAYAASKGAIEAFSRALALEIAPQGVTVNVIAPATIDTDIMGGPITDDRKPKFLAQLPVGRIGTPGEVAALIEFLIGEEAGYITGATYNINGGLRIG
jgi:NAD(P)-dependent dehydrogenase (short-subunit alcohol dehydrogenase family)